MSKKKYPLRIPRSANGIRSQEPRSGARRIWWAERWQRTLEAMCPGVRLGKARSYAISGQVVGITIESSHVEAVVVGSRPEPYAVTVDFRTPDPEQRARIKLALAKEPILAARLLAGDLPFEAEEAFRLEGLDLFPGGKLAPGRYDMTTRCSCPDYANPCKHTLAALCILGEEVARRPSLLLELRGIDVDELIPSDIPEDS